MPFNLATRTISRSVLPALQRELGRARYLERALPALAKEAMQSRRHSWRDPGTTALLTDVAVRAGISLDEVPCPYAQACAADLRHARLSADSHGVAASLAAVFNQAVVARNGRLDAILALARRLYKPGDFDTLASRFERAKVSVRYKAWLQNRLDLTP